MKTVAIIGAGPSGLISAKHALDAGLVPIVFEKHSDLGGIWQPESGAVWDTMHTNLSYFSCMFADLPWEDGAEDFPSQTKLYQYLCKYAEKFNLKKYIKFNSQVIELKENDQQWEVNWHAQDEHVTQLFDHVVVACGIFSEENIPKFSGLETFQGKQLHSRNYKDSNQFKDKVVAIVGNGFSGIEIASDLVHSAKVIHHIFRTPHWVLPRYVPLEPAKQDSAKWPLDLLFYNRLQRTQSEEIKFKTQSDNQRSNAYMNSLCHLQGEISAGLQIPNDAWNNPSKVTISDTYIDEVKTGKIIVKQTNINAFDSDGLILANGEKCSADAVIFCTGYKLKLPFFNQDLIDHLEFDEHDQLQPLILYKCTFRPEFRNLAFVGVYRGPYFAVMELQARWAMAVFSGKVDFPSTEQFNIGLEEERKIRALSPRPQFPHGDYVGLADSIAKEIGCLPDFKKLETNNPLLYKLLYEGPVVPEDYCFVQDGKLVTEEAHLLRFTTQLNKVKTFLTKCTSSPEEAKRTMRNEHR